MAPEPGAKRCSPPPAWPTARREHFLPDKALIAGNTLCISKINNDEWRKMGRCDLVRPAGDCIKAEKVAASTARQLLRLRYRMRTK